MTIKIAICDDSMADSHYLTKLLKEWGHHRPIEIQSFSSAEAFLFHYEEEKDFDILLLDIEMGQMDGVSLAKKIRQENKAIQILFITGYSDYIADGYEVAALHYLLKPVKEEALFRVLDRAIDNLQKNEKELLIKTPHATFRIPIGQVTYLEVQQNYVTIHGNQEVKVKRTLGEFEQELDDRFYRLGRSYIVNLTCIRRISKSEVVLADGSTLPLPRGYYDALNRALIART